MREVTFALVLLATVPAPAQIFERSAALPPADLVELDSSGAAHLERAKRFLAESQWEEAVEAIRRVQEGSGESLIQVDLAEPIAGFERFVPAATYCQWRLAALAKEAPPALEHYRRLVDPLAEQWYRAGVDNRDERLLARVAQQAFASKWGDDALLALGDLALARGEPSVARAAWRRIRPELSRSAGEAFPDSDLPAADVQSRLVLASILEGSLDRARVELQSLRTDSPDASGTIAGKSGKYVDLLAGLLDEAKGWPQRALPPDWQTLGGNLVRNRVAPADIDIAGRPLWSFALPKLHSDRELIGAGRLRAGDDGKALLSYHPVVIGRTVLLRCDARERSYVVALDLASGSELWRVDYRRAVRRPAAAESQDAAEGPFEVSDAHADSARHVGVARYTLSVAGSKAFVRMGSPITSPSARRRDLWLAKDQGFLLGLDLPAQGKPLEGFPIRPESTAWSFEGAPISTGGLMYVVMRRTDGARSQFYIAAYELQTTATVVDDEDDNARPGGRLKWRTRICSSATLGGGDLDEISHLLLSLAGGTLYLNTNAGVVAAVDAHDGSIRWIVRYPRAAFRSGDPDRGEQHFFRDSVPCLVHKDLVIVAPADCDRIFAVEAASGQLAWALPPGAAADAVHLLGVGSDTLLASGDWLYWIDASTGRLLTQFPQAGFAGAGQAAPSPRGLGRGVLAGGHVYYPTRESIYVFDHRPVKTDFGWQPRLVREIRLAPRGVTGGNLVISDGILLIATGDRLVAFGQ
jgi:outer membrane protein assembly factor BamB